MPRSTLLVLACAVALCAARIALPGFSDPSEGRYAQMSREMAASGDWLVPRWQGVPHLEKPPLAYWAGAAGIALFGRHPFAARLGPAIALALTAWLAAGIARRTAGPKSALPVAALILLAPYPLLVGAACLTDVYVLLAATLFFLAVLKRLQEDDQRALTWAVIALAVGILAKGHAIFLFTLLPLLLARTGIFRELWRPGRVLLLLVLVVPWFVFVERRYPGFFTAHVVKLGDFLGKGRQHHRAPFYIYAVVLLLGVFPFSLYVTRGLRVVRGETRRLLLLWVLVPFLVLTVIRSRTWTYILPAITPWIVLGVAGTVHPLPAERGLRTFAGVLGLVAAPVALLVRPPIAPALLYWIAGGVAVAAIVFLALRTARAVPLGLALAGVVSVTLIGASTADESAFKVHREIARRAEKMAGPDGRIIVISTNTPSIAFYIERPIVFAKGPHRLREEAARWGGSEYYWPEPDVAEILNSDYQSVIVIHEEILAKYGPHRRAVYSERNMRLLGRERPGG